VKLQTHNFRAHFCKSKSAEGIFVSRVVVYIKTRQFKSLKSVQKESVQSIFPLGTNLGEEENF